MTPLSSSKTFKDVPRRSSQNGTRRPQDGAGPSRDLPGKRFAVHLGPTCNRCWTTVGSIADRLGIDLGACVGVRRLPSSPYVSVYGLSDDDDDDDDDDADDDGMVVAAITTDIFFKASHE